MSEDKERKMEQVQQHQRRYLRFELCFNQLMSIFYRGQRLYQRTLYQREEAEGGHELDYPLHHHHHPHVHVRPLRHHHHFHKSRMTQGL